MASLSRVTSGLLILKRAQSIPVALYHANVSYGKLYKSDLRIFYDGHPYVNNIVK